MGGLRLKELRDENDMTQPELCRILKERYEYEIDKSLISKYENGVHEPNFNFIDLVSSIFNVSTDYMMGRSDQRYDPIENPRKIPLINEGLVVAEEITKYEYSVEPADFCIIAQDDSMIGARILKGDKVFIKKQSEIDHGELAIVQIEAEGILIRRILKVNGSVVLHPENTSFKDSIYTKKDVKQIKILGKVLYIKAEVK